MIKQFTFSLIFLLTTVSIFGQGQAPRKTKWREIDSKHANIIYPEELEEQAQRAANLVDYLYEFETKTLKTHPAKLPLILYGQSTTTNGFAALRPRRSAWYVTPSQYATALGSDDWFQTLASHEYRHIVQYSKSNQYLTQILRIFFGETGTLIGMYSYPYWFFEGDAICTETALGSNGRGRIPQFETGIRTQLLNDVKYKYSKAKLNSYKDYYPSHYNLGWLLASYAREKYGADVFDKTLNHADKIALCPFAFSRGLKKSTGLNERQLYDEAMQYYDSVWSVQDAKNKSEHYQPINTRKKTSYTRYGEAHWLENGDILVKKSSLDDIDALYILKKDGSEQKLRNVDASLISVNAGKAVWTNQIPDMRWQAQSWSDIYIFDIEINKLKRLTVKQKYFAPSLSPDGERIACVEHTSSMKTALLILDAETGTEIKRFPNPENEFIRTPEWSEDGTKIVYTHTGHDGTALSIVDVKAADSEQITDYNFDNISRPVFYKNSIIFNAPYNGIGNIYKTDIDTKKCERLTFSRYGAYNPDIQNDMMLFADYSLSGYNIVQVDLTTVKTEDTENMQDLSLHRADILQAQEQGENVFSGNAVPANKFESHKYKQFRHSLNLHSWGLRGTDSESEIAFDIYSGNVLNNTFGLASAVYDFNTGLMTESLTARFAKYYPIFDITGGYSQQKNVFTTTTETATVRWDESFVQTQVSLPFDFSRTIWSRALTLKSAFSLNKIQNESANYYDYYRRLNNPFGVLSYSASFYNYRRTVAKDVAPVGQYVYVGFRHTLGNELVTGSQFALYGSVYLPTFIRHHNLNIRAGYEKQSAFATLKNPTDYWFSTIFNYARGHDYTQFNSYHKVSADYRFPIWFPDISVGSLVYFTRLKGDLFYDYEQITAYADTPDLVQFTRQSVGAEFYLQFYLFRLQEPLEIGERISYPFTRTHPEVVFELTLDIPI